MLQRYIHALADLSVNVKTYQHGISGAVARDTPVPSDCAKKCQQSQVSNLSQATRSSINIYSKSFFFKHICKPSGGAGLSGLSPGQSGHPRIVRTWTRIVRTNFFPGYKYHMGDGFLPFRLLLLPHAATFHPNLP